MYTLVVVDMQPHFNAANGRRIIKNCKRELNKAMSVHAAIVFVEYFGSFPTVKELTNVTKHYHRVYTTYKHVDDGSEQVEQLISDWHLAAKKVRVCGVNTDCCVWATVNGLTSRLPRSTIEVVADACDSDYNHAVGLDRMSKMENVVLK
jgi:nicotinamidase-related amidase